MYSQYTRVLDVQPIHTCARYAANTRFLSLRTFENESMELILTSLPVLLLLLFHLRFVFTHLNSVFFP